MQGEIRVRRWKADELPAGWFKRATAEGKEETDALEEKVRGIVEGVRENGDKGLLDFALKFDNAKLNADNLKVTADEIKAAYAAVTAEQINAIKFMKDRLQSRETQVLQQQTKQQLKTSSEGIIVQTVLRSIESVGCYVPGGLAAYPSSVVMTAVPAKVAGVSRVVVCSPVKGAEPVDPLILVAADICDVDEIYKVGGAQAIAALAYGTETIGKVRKIVGPGNKYVMMAKMLVSNDVAIDMPAGPSEVLVLADDTADPRAVAADMISQCEHTPDSASGLITTSEKLGDAVVEWLEKLVAQSERKDIITQSLESYGFIMTCATTAEMIELANTFAPEHLEIMASNPQGIADKIATAGLILLGPYTPVALSDYASGTNHVLPTGGFGASYSGLSVLDFTRRVNIVESSREGLENARKAIGVLTQAERLPNHYRAVEERFEK